MSNDPKSPAADRLRVINRREVAALFGVSTATLSRMVSAGHMPSPIQLSPRRIGWQVGVLLDWLAAQSVKSSTRLSENSQSARRKAS